MPKSQLEYHIKNYPFMCLPMFDDALETAEISLEDFIEFSNNLEENIPSSPHTVFLSSTARSASTLFGAMLHHPGYSICFGEPHVFSSLATGYTEGYWTDEVSLAIFLRRKYFSFAEPSGM
uniref:Sulfotransferase n=1 Tax=Panagrolaimus davidi TaxID=227884 RepID=A0A914QX69_9BILA